MNLRVLRQLIVKHFDLEELHTITFDLEVDFDNLPGQGREAKARDLISYLKRTDQLNSLLQILKERRPGVDWDVVIQDREQLKIDLVDQLSRISGKNQNSIVDRTKLLTPTYPSSLTRYCEVYDLSVDRINPTISELVQQFNQFANQLSKLPIKYTETSCYFG